MRVNKFRPDIKRPDDGEKRTHFLRPDQALTLLGHISRSRFPNPWSPALATFLFGQGARVGETMAIDGRDDVSLEHRYAILRDTKNGKERMVNLCPASSLPYRPFRTLERKDRFSCAMTAGHTKRKRAGAIS